MIGRKVKNKNSLKELLIFITFCYNIIVVKDHNSDIVYILIWESPHLTPALNSEDGQRYFVYKECNTVNCHLSRNKTIDDIKNIDVILFNSMTLNTPNATIPSLRWKWQKYVFMSNEPPGIAPIPSHYNGFFNLTWTYKLDSDSLWRYFMVKDKKDEIVGPARFIQWIDINDMEPISNATEVQLQSKKVAAAWFPSQCKTESKREEFVNKLEIELEKYELKIDIFGPCGNPKKTISKYTFYDLVESDYYFYLAFEKSICEDYVTEEVLIATNHFAVPIVYGGADYTRFLPSGSYLNAYALGPQELAKIMNDTIYDLNKYYDFFKWQRYYTIHAQSEGAEFDGICNFCTYLNDIKREYLYKTRVYTNITKFWKCS